jgi:chitinase
MLKRLREDHQVKVHLCIGGWDRSQGFAAIAATEESRRRFATGLTAYCRKHQFAGADLDWEHPENAPEATNYGRLLGAIAVAFKPAGLRLTAAMAGWQTLTPEAIAAVDAIHLMSYDNPGKHSTFEGAKADVRKMRDQGLPASKIRLGLPFYGRGITERDMAKTYAGIVAAAPGSADTNESQGMYFNGPSMIRAKTRFAKDQRLGGVMIWEMGQDAPGDGSLLKVIDESIK